MRVLSLLLLVSLASSAQERLVSIANPLSDHVSDNYSLVTIPDQDAFVLTFPGEHGIQRIVKQNGYAEVRLLQQVADTAYALEGFRKTMAIPKDLIRIYYRYRPLNGCYHNRVLIEAIQHRQEKKIYLLRTDLATGQTEITDTLLYEDRDDLLSCSRYGKELKLILARKGTSEFHVFTVGMDGSLRKKTIDFPFQLDASSTGGLRTGPVDLLSDLFYPNRFSSYEEGLPYPALMARSRLKTFEQKGRTVFLISASDARTHALILDLATDSLRHQVYRQGGTRRQTKLNNAFLVDTVVVTARVEERALNLEYFHLLTGERLGTQVIDEQTSKSQTVSAIEKKGNFWTKTDVRTATVRQFLDCASGNGLAISVFRKEEGLLVDLAAPYNSEINASNLASLAATVAGSYAINSAPNTTGYFTTIFPSVQAVTYYGFQTAVGRADFLFHPMQVTPIVWEKLAVQLGAGHHLLGFMNGYFYLSHADHSDRRVHISRYAVQKTGVNSGQENR